MAHQTISVTEFKAKCLSLLDQVQQEGVSITITKRGKPIATVEALRKTRNPTLAGRWAKMFPELLATLGSEDFDILHLYKPERML